MNLTYFKNVGGTALIVLFTGLLTACNPVYDAALSINTSNDVPGKIFRSTESFAVRHSNIDAFPDCRDPKVLERIFRKVVWSQEKHTYFGSPLVSIDRISQRHITSGDPEMAGVTRRYCRARAHQQNGGRHTMHYLIEQRGGYASQTWGVEYCVQSHDKYKVYDASCRTLRR